MSGSAADVVPTQEVFPQPQIRLCALVEKMKNGTLTPRSSAAADLPNGYLTCTRFPIPGPTNSFPDTSATASASSPSFTGTLLRTNSMARSLSDSYARKFRTIRGFPSESKVVTRMFHPAGILMRHNCRRSMTCLIQTDLVRHRGLIIPGLSPNESNAD